MTVTSPAARDVADRSATPAEPRRRAGSRAPRRAPLPAVVHGASLLLGYAGLLVLLRGTWFRGDDFEFLANRVGPDPRLDLWLPHNEHWSTGPILVWRAVYDLVGMSSNLPYLALSVGAHVVTAHLLWRLMRRTGVDDWVATGLAATFVVLGAGHENITWAFQFGFMGSLALGLTALLLLARGSRAAFAGAVAVSMVSLTFSGVSVVLVGMGTLFLLTSRRWREAAGFAGSTGAVYLTWYALAGRGGSRPPHSQEWPDRVAGAAPWVWRALTASLEALVSAPGAGWLLLLLLVAGAVRHLRDRVLREGALPVPVTGLLVAVVGGLLAQIGSLAIQRGDISLPGTPRYVYVFLALLLPLIGLALTVRGGRAVRALVGLFVGYLVVTQAAVLLAAERPLEAAPLQADTLGLAALVADGEQVRGVDLAVDVNARSAVRWVEHGSLGDLDAVPEQAVSDARAQVQVELAPTAPAGAVPGGLVAAGDEAITGACVRTITTPGERAATLRLTPGTTVSVVAPDGGTVGYQVVEPGPASRTLSAPVEPNRTYWFAVTEPLTVDLLALEGQSLDVCGATVP